MDLIIGLSILAVFVIAVLLLKPKQNEPTTGWKPKGSEDNNGGGDETEDKSL